MECRLCGHPNTHKHGLMPNGHQRYICLQCKQTFSESFNTLYYWRRVSPQQVQQVLQTHSGIVRQQTGRWHRRQNKFGKMWEQSDCDSAISGELIQWIWQHRRLKTTAAQRAELADQPWTWHDIVTYPTIL